MCKITIVVWNKMENQRKITMHSIFFQTISLTACRCSVSHKAFLCEWWRIMTTIPIRTLFCATMALTRGTRADSGHRCFLRSLFCLKSLQHHIKKHTLEKKSSVLGGKYWEYFCGGLLCFFYGVVNLRIDSFFFLHLRLCVVVLK